MDCIPLITIIVTYLLQEGRMKRIPKGFMNKLINILNISGYFYHEDFIKKVVFDQDWKKTRDPTDFINYYTFDEYYEKDKNKIKLYLNGEKSTVEYPYKEIINYIVNPDTEIRVTDYRDYRMSESLKLLTQKNLDKFKKEKPKTTDGPILRMKSLNQLPDNNYECILEKATYFDQARTNLSLDFPLERSDDKTLRLKDMDGQNNLRTLEESLMANTIGVSGVVYFRKNNRLYFFMALRKELGVFEQMFGTTSGVVEQPKLCYELTQYATSEMEREFTLETGLNSKVIKSVIPLALTRELIRGGKPQFFFLIEIHKVESHDFSKKFRTSDEGPEEFYNVIGRLRRHRSVLSPEFNQNLIYAFQKLYKDKRLYKDNIFQSDELNLNNGLI